MKQLESILKNLFGNKYLKVLSDMLQIPIQLKNIVSVNQYKGGFVELEILYEEERITLCYVKKEEYPLRIYFFNSKTEKRYSHCKGIFQLVTEDTRNTNGFYINYKKRTFVFHDDIEAFLREGVSMKDAMKWLKINEPIVRQGNITLEGIKKFKALSIRGEQLLYPAPT